MERRWLLKQIEGRMRAGSGGTSPTPLPGSARHAQPGSILYASRVNKMSLARARLDPASGSGWFGFRAVIWPARETVVRAGKELQGRSSVGEGIPTPLCTPRCLGRRRTQAGVIIRTDSQRNVSRTSISGRPRESEK